MGLKPSEQSHLFGIAYIMVFIALIAGVGIGRGWNVSAGDFQFRTVYNNQRFTPEPSDRNEAASYYYWQLPQHKATPLTRSFVWICYLSHQFLSWGLIFAAQTATYLYSDELRWFNIYSLIIHGVFLMVHLIQTHITYDGLAQDVTMGSSQDSVVMIIVFIIVMEYRDRGFFFTWPNVKELEEKEDDQSCSKKCICPSIATKLFRKYHGYAFSWGAIYTFWYHPCEPTWAHFFGFFHVGLLMLQNSLMFTRVHLNRYWRLLLESWVALHATVVAWQQWATYGSLNWLQFFFGFSLVLVVTQIWMIRSFREGPIYVRVLPSVLYVGGLVAAYAAYNRWGFLLQLEPFRIGGALWLFAALAMFWSWVIEKITIACCGEQEIRRVGSEEKISISMTQYICVAISCLLCYGTLMTISIVLENTRIFYTTSSVTWLFVFGSTAPITSIIFFQHLERVLGRVADPRKQLKEAVDLTASLMQNQQDVEVKPVELGTL